MGIFSYTTLFSMSWLSDISCPQYFHWQFMFSQTRMKVHLIICRHVVIKLIFLITVIRYMIRCNTYDIIASYFQMKAWNFKIESHGNYFLSQNIVMSSHFHYLTSSVDSYHHSITILWCTFYFLLQTWRYCYRQLCGCAYFSIVPKRIKNRILRSERRMSVLFFITRFFFNYICIATYSVDCRT